MLASRQILAHRVLGAVDLAIDFATLGEYGLEPMPASGRCRERPGHVTGWEALPTARSRAACDAGEGRHDEESRPGGRLEEKPAATYSPGRLRTKYHRR